MAASTVIVKLQINPTVQPMLGGLAASGGSGEIVKITNTVAPATNDTWFLDLLNNQTQVDYLIGFSTITGLVPIFCFTYDQKVYVLAGNTVYFCAVGEPTVWNDINATGNGFVSMANSFQTPEALTAIVTFQGRLAFFSRHTTQLWDVNADPDLWALKQVLNNVGTMAPASVQALGGLDALFLSDTGIRSLRVRDINLNAFVEDLGSPIDSLIQAQLLASPSNAVAAIAIVEPSAERYMLYLNGTIYVLSYFPSSKVVAWGTYLPTAETGFHFTINASTNGFIAINAPCFDGVTRPLSGAVPWHTNAATTAADLVIAINAQTGTTHWTASAVGAVVTLTTVGVVNSAALASSTLTGDITITAFVLDTTTFTPTKAVVYNGQVHYKVGNIVYRYGGYGNNEYDSTVATIQTPWLDFKTPGNRKVVKGFQIACTGAWSISAGMDPQSALVELVYTNNGFSFDLGIVGQQAQGSHMSIKAVTTGYTAAVLSGIIPHYEQADEL